MRLKINNLPQTRGGSSLFGVTRFVWNAMGAKIEKDAFLSASALVLEADLLNLDSGTFVEDQVTLFGHSFQTGKLEFSPVTVGKSCEIGALSVLLPGTETGDFVQVQPLTQVMGGEHLSDQSRYGGSPMEWLGPASHGKSRDSEEGACSAV